MRRETQVAVWCLIANFEAVLERLKGSMSPADYVSRKWLVDEARAAMEKEENGRN